MNSFRITLLSLALCMSHSFIPIYTNEYNLSAKETVSKLQDSRYLIDEKDNSDYDNETGRRVYSFEDFNKRDSLMDEYKGLVQQKNGRQTDLITNEESIEKIFRNEKTPDFEIINSLYSDEQLSVILYDRANDNMAFLAINENADNFLVSINDYDYLVNGTDENCWLESDDGTKIPLIETYYDSYFAEHSFFHMSEEELKYESQRGTWNLLYSGQYYANQNFTVSIISIVTAIVSAGVSLGYITVSGLVNSILAYFGVGWAVGSSFVQTYIIYQSKWYHSDCLIYYKTKSDYYVLPKSANGSTVTATLDFYKYGYMVNAAPGNRPGACAYMSEYEDGPYSYH